jgi:hypothetical protein
MRRYVVGHAVLGLELGHAQRRVEREVDVVPEVDRPALGPSAERREAVAARLSGLEDLGVVLEIERQLTRGLDVDHELRGRVLRAPEGLLGSVGDRDDVAAAVAVRRTGRIVSPSWRYVSACTTPSDARTVSSSPMRVTRP